MNEQLISKPYRFWNYRVMPKYSGKRGFTKVKKFLKDFSTFSLEKIDEKGETPISNFEWDNLVILDGCRLDTFERVVGDCDSRISLGSHTKEYVKRNFSEGDWEDIVYITGSPQLSPSKFREYTGRELDKTFYEVFKTYETDWDDDFGSVRPQPIARDAVTAEKLFPNRRKIIHFMQPHFPFLENEELNNTNKDIKEKSPWHRIMKGNLEPEAPISAYRENLEEIIPFIEELDSKLEGKTVVTSDHGNFLGENGLYGHSPGIKCRVLRQVPLYEMD